MTLLIGILIVSAVATAGDFTWYTLGVRHTLLAGVIHGAVLLTSVGGTLGAVSGKTSKGLPIGALAGVGGALTYYAIVALGDGRPYGAAIPTAWVATWLMLAVLDGRWLRAPDRRSWTAVAIRGVIAAIASGIAFGVVLDTLWGAPSAGARNYAIQFAAWIVAWAPGLLSLAVGRSLFERR